ncbi:hypothetical protein SAMN05216567_103415 [Variovorax sp. OK605]|nr:hypothetical protein SAMN05216567_103415 [Variovorax sp. OK605]
MPSMKPPYGPMLLALSVLCLAVLPAWADGTVSFKADVLPMLKAKPAFEKFLLGTLQVTDAGSGTRISDQAMPRLGGTRMGPYEFMATWHDASGDVPVTLIVQTNTRFLDSAGREIKTGSLKQAARLQETFDSIQIEPRR